MPLSDTQTLILTAAAQHPDGVATPPASLPPAPRAAVAKALLKSGLLASAGTEHNGAGVAWKVDGVTVILHITEAGRRAIGAESEGRSAPPAAPAAALAAAPVMTMPADRDSESRTASADFVDVRMTLGLQSASTAVSRSV